MAYFAAIAFLLALSAPINADKSLGGLVYAPGHASKDYYSYPKYAFEYAVRDPHTGDNKAQWEKRDGDVVIGAYSLVEPDGSLRVVEYRADDKTGFNAVVKRIGPNIHPIATPIYKASIPSLGYKSYLPQPIGRVAGLEKLANAPLYNRAYSGSAISGLLYKPIAPGIIKEVVPITPLGKIIEAPVSTPLLRYNAEIIPAPINKGPIIPELIYKGSIIPEPIYKGPIIPESLYKRPIIPESIYKGPIIPEPIYKGPIIPEPIYKGLITPEPIYKRPTIYAPLYKGPSISAPLYKGPIISAPFYKGPIIPEAMYKGPIIPEAMYKGPIIPEPIYKGLITPEPIYKRPTIYAPLYKGPTIYAPLYKGPSISAPLYKGPIISAPFYKGPIIPEAMYKGPIIPEAMYKGPIIPEAMYKGPIIPEAIYKRPNIPIYKGPINPIYNVPIPQYPVYKAPIVQAPYRPAISPIPISKQAPLLRDPINYSNVGNSGLGLPALNLEPNSYRGIDYSLLSKALIDYSRLIGNKAPLEYKDIPKYNAPLVYKGYTG